MTKEIIYNTSSLTITS